MPLEGHSPVRGTPSVPSSGDAQKAAVWRLERGAGAGMWPATPWGQRCAHLLGRSSHQQPRPRTFWTVKQGGPSLRLFLLCHRMT